MPAGCGSCWSVQLSFSSAWINDVIFLKTRERIHYQIFYFYSKPLPVSSFYWESVWCANTAECNYCLAKAASCESWESLFDGWAFHSSLHLYNCFFANIVSNSFGSPFRRSWEFSWGPTYCPCWRGSWAGCRRWWSCYGALGCSSALGYLKTSFSAIFADLAPLPFILRYFRCSFGTWSWRAKKYREKYLSSPCLLVQKSWAACSQSTALKIV